MKALNKTLAITPLTYNLVDDPDARAYSNSVSVIVLTITIL